MRLILASIIVFAFAISNLKAKSDSTEIVELDPILLSPKTSLPFDRIFYLKIKKSKKEKIVLAIIQKKNIRDKTKRFSRREVYRVRSSYGLNPKPKRKKDHEKDVFENCGKNRYERIELSSTIGDQYDESIIIDKGEYFLLKMFPLSPKQTYSIEFTKRENNRSTKIKDAIYSFFLNTPPQSTDNSKGLKELEEKSNDFLKKKKEFESKINQLQTLHAKLCKDKGKLVNARNLNIEDRLKLEALLTDSISYLKLIREELSTLGLPCDIKDEFEKRVNKLETDLELDFDLYISKLERDELSPYSSLEYSIDTCMNSLDSMIKRIDSIYFCLTGESTRLCEAKLAFNKKGNTENCECVDGIEFLTLTTLEQLARVNYQNLKKLELLFTDINTSECSNICNRCREHSLIDNGQIKIDSLFKNYIEESKNIQNDMEAIVLYDTVFNKGEKWSKLSTVKKLQLKTDSISIEFDSFIPCYRELMRELIENDSTAKCLSKIDCFTVCNDLLRLPFGRKETWKYISDGLLPINYKSQLEKLPAENLESRLKNLKITADYLEKLISIGTLLTKDDCNSVATAQLTKLYQKIDLMKKTILPLNQVTNAISNYEIGDREVFSDYDVIDVLGKSTGHATLTSKSKFSVRPDFGIAYATNVLRVGDYSTAYNTLIPFFGVRLNFRPLDPDYPFQNIPYKNFWHRSSINISYSFTSLTDDNGTRSDLYEERSFLLGYGFRINNAVNLTAGGVLFNRENPDPLVSGNQLTAMPYVGASVDLDIFDTFNKLFNVFSK